MIHYSKPHPEVYLLAAKKLHLKESDCLVVEDAISGCIAAISTAYGNPFATYHFNSFKDLLIIMERVNGNKKNKN